MEHSLLANHERQFAMPLQREARTDRHTSGKQLWTRSSRRTTLAGRQRADGPPEQWRRTRTSSMPFHADVRAA